MDPARARLGMLRGFLAFAGALVEVKLARTLDARYRPAAEGAGALRRMAPGFPLPLLLGPCAWRAKPSDRDPYNPSMADAATDELLWDDEPREPDVSFRRHLWGSFGIFAALVALSLGILTWIYLRTLSDKALSMAMEKGQESADEIARSIQEVAEKHQGDLYTIVREQKEVDAAIAPSGRKRQIVERWAVFDHNGRQILSSRRLTSDVPAVEEPLEGPPHDTHQVIAVERELLLRGKRAGLLRLFLSEPVMMRQVEEFQRGVREKVLLGAGATLACLLTGFLYVTRLLERTRRIHDQAETRLRLASLGALAGGLAHEIRNPLNAMSIAVQLLEEDVAASGPADRTAWRESLARTRAEIRRLDDLVGNVLTYSRPFTPERQPVALGALVHDLAALVRPELEAKRIELHVDVASDMTIPVDGPKLRQALLNAIRNAGQALDGEDRPARDGSPRGRVLLRLRRDGSRAVLDVEDDGPGIPIEERDQLFRTFSSRKPGGTGLGLPIARKIARAHGGELEVAPLAPRGTRVRLTLPIG